MAHDFILGSTGTNWSRGFSVLLPQTPDSSSMEEKTTDSDAAKAKIVAYIRESAKLHAGSELYRQAKQGDPGALDAIKIMVSKAKAGDPQAVRDVAIMKEAQKDFAESEKHQANIRLQDDLLRARSPMQGESLNDDELAVARDGGPSERAAFARVRGSSSIGRATPAQLAAQMVRPQTDRLHPLMDRTRTVPAASTTTSWPWPATAATANEQPLPACAEGPP